MPTLGEEAAAGEGWLRPGYAGAPTAAPASFARERGSRKEPGIRFHTSQRQRGAANGPRGRALLLGLIVATLGVASSVRADEAARDAGSGDAGAEALADAPAFDAEALVRRVEDVMRGETAQMKARMRITTPRWKRTVEFRSWDDRTHDRSFIRILSPSKDRGTGFLRVDETFWTWLPRVERTMRVPPSMMLQPWMGSDFTNDDLARESSLIDDYTAHALGDKVVDGQPAWGVELRPLPEAPVVWARLEIWIAKDPLTPILYLYYDEPEPGRYELLRRMELSRVKEVQGRPVPHYWKMTPLDKEGHITEIELLEMKLDEPLADSLFTQKNLRRAEGVR